MSAWVFYFMWEMWTFFKTLNKGKEMREGNKKRKNMKGNCIYCIHRWFLNCLNIDNLGYVKEAIHQYTCFDLKKIQNHPHLMAPLVRICKKPWNKGIFYYQVSSIMVYLTVHSGKMAFPVLPFFVPAPDLLKYGLQAVAFVL